MTRYSIDLSTLHLIATYETGTGDISTTVGSIPAFVEKDVLLPLARSLTHLSSGFWFPYVYGSQVKHNERATFKDIEASIRDPDMELERTLVVDDSDIRTLATHVGRLLVYTNDIDLLDAILVDVEADMSAAESAERGNFAGRSAQAVIFTRLDAPPTQVVAADALLRKEPFGNDDLFSLVDPTSACIAAAHWLDAAAYVASEESGTPVLGVLVAADNIQVVPHVSPNEVLARIDRGETPREAILTLVGQAVAFKDGHVPDIQELVRRVVDAIEQSVKYASLAPNDSPLLGILLSEIRLTTLDMARPAVVLLEEMLEGISGCYLLYREHAALVGSHDEEVEGEADEESEDSNEALTMLPFLEAVRARAAETGSRLD